MKFLLDMPLSPHIAAWLNDRGHDAVHASTIGLGRASDRELLERAVSEGRIVITADTDFPQLMALSRATLPGIILFRGGNYTSKEIQELLKQGLEAAPEDLFARSICTIDRKRIRHRPLPLR